MFVAGNWQDFLVPKYPLGRRDSQTYASDVSSQWHLKTLTTRFIFSITLTCSYLSTELYYLIINQAILTKNKRTGKNVSEISKNGNNRYCLKTQTVSLTNLRYDSFKLFRTIFHTFPKNYQNIFALTIIIPSQPKLFSKSKHIKYHNLGQISNANASCHIFCYSFIESITSHGMKGTDISRLLEYGHASPIVALRAEHRFRNTLRPYQKLYQFSRL